MAERITKKQIQNLVDSVGKKNNLPTKPKFIKDRKQGEGVYEEDWLKADYNPIYGGWELVVVDKNHGGHHYFKGAYGRMKTKEFYAYLRGLSEE